MGLDVALQGTPLGSKLEVVKVGTTTVSKGASSTTGTETIAHGLNFVPYMICYVTSTYWGSLTALHPYTELVVAGGTPGTITLTTRVFVDDTNLQFDVVAPNSGSNNAYDTAFDVEFKYFLCRYAANQ